MNLLVRAAVCRMLEKTERNLATRLSEHLDHVKSAVSKHLIDCDHANYLLNMNNLFDNLNDSDSSYSYAELVTNNAKILQSLNRTNSNLLLSLEALHIQFKKLELNSGLKASKELIVFLRI